MTFTEIQKQATEHSDSIIEKCARVRKIFNFIGVRNRRLNILDVGCYDGTLKDLSQTHNIYGVDLTESLRDRVMKQGYKGYEVADLGTDPLPFTDIAFDMVILGECIEHISDTDWLLNQINSRLRHGGELILTFPNIRTPIGIAMLLLANRVPMFGAGYRSVHARDFTTNTIREALANNGFKIMKMVGSDFCVSGNANGILSWLATPLPSWSSSVVVKAVKETDSIYAAKTNPAPKSLMKWISGLVR